LLLAIFEFNDRRWIWRRKAPDPLTELPPTAGNSVMKFGFVFMGIDI
jgi:hypothetical protein